MCVSVCVWYERVRQRGKALVIYTEGSHCQCLSIRAGRPWRSRRVQSRLPTHTLTQAITHTYLIRKRGEKTEMLAPITDALALQCIDGSLSLTGP